MIFMIGIIVIAVVLIVVMRSSSRRIAEVQNRAEFERRMDSRIDSYRDFIRREMKDPDIENQTDNELNDYIALHIRSYNSEQSNADGLWKNILFGFAALGVFGAFALPNNILDLIFSDPMIKGVLIYSLIIIVSGYIIGTITSKIIKRKIDKRFLDAGWDINQLRL